MTKLPSTSLAPSRALAALVALPALLAHAPMAQAAEVNLYTHREPGLIKPLLDRYTAATGVKVNVVFAKAGLAERIQSEGEKSPADLLLTVDIATLSHAAKLGISQPLVSEAVNAAVPPAMRAKDGSWVALSQRARVIYASKAKIADKALTYDDLADPRFKGRFCIRSGQHDYNNALISAMIGHIGAEKTEAWVKGLRANLAKKPSGGDRDVAKDIAAGLCDIGLGNTYYVGLMNKDANQKAWSDAIRVIVPTFKEGGGTHVNVSGIALAKFAPNKAEAITLVDWLVGKDAQEFYAAKNFEYPVRAGIAVEPFIASFGSVAPDTLPLDDVAKHRKTASEIVEKTGFDLGPNS